MATRRELIQRVLRNVYGDFPSQDSSITENLVNTYINTAIGVATRNAYRDSIQIDGVAYLNNSFYTTYKGITFSSDEKFLYKIALPEIPKGLGKNEGIASLTVKTLDGNLSYDAIPLSTNQASYYKEITPKPQKLAYYSEGGFAYVFSKLILSSGYTANIRMASGGDASDLDSVLNVPDDYISVIFDYCVEKLRLERNSARDLISDGNDN